MLTSKSVESGFSLADEFADKGYSIVPVANTPLAMLYKATNDLECCYDSFNAINGSDAISMASNIANRVQLAKELELNSTNAYKLHDEEMDKYIRIIKTAVNNHLDITKNIVRPIVLELAEKTMSYFSNDAARNPSDDFNVIPVEPCPIFAMTGFDSTLERYTNKLPTPPKYKIRLKEDKTLLEADVVSIVSDFYSDLKAEMLDWFGNIENEDTDNSGRVSFFLSPFFTTTLDNVDVNINQENMSCCDDMSILNKYAVIYTLALYLYERPEYGIGYSLNEYKEAVAQLRDYAGSRVCQYLKKIDILNRSKTLILKSDTRNNLLIVNGPLYRAWLQDGNSPEILYSILINGEGMATISTIEESKAMLLEKWKKWNVLREVAFKNNSLQRFKDHLYIAFTEQLKDLQDIELQYFKQDKARLVDTIMKRFDEGLAHIKMHSMDNIYKTCRKLVCRARFFYTPADKILSSIEEYSNSDPNIDPQEASLMATIEYVADYVAEQLNLSNKI